MAISLHNSVVSTANSSTSSLTVGPLTASIGEIIVVQINTETPGSVPTVLSISDGTANVYHKRFSATQATEPVFGSGEGYDVWWAYAANALTAATITATLSVATDDCIVIAAGYQGFTGTSYQTAPWDTNASLPKTAQNTSTSTAGSVTGVSTTSTAGMLLWGLGTCDWNLSPPGPGAPSGFTLVQRGTNTGGSNANQGNLFGEAYSSAVSSATITSTTPSTTLGWIVWADALTDQVIGGGSVASSSGTGAASGVGSSSATSVGSATGTGTASGVGRSTATSVGSASGVGTATGIGRALLTAIATSTGSGAASGIGASTAVSIGSASGIGTASATGQSTATSVASSSGTGTATGTALSIAASVGSSSGSATVLGVGQSIGGGSVGTSVGIGTASGIGASTATSTASSSGTSIVSGVGASLFSSVATSIGVGTATAIGLGSTASIATSSGVSTVTGIAVSTAASVGSSAGIGTATGVGNSSSTSSVGIAAGTSTVLGFSAVTISSVGTASGSCVVTGISDFVVGGGKAWRWKEGYDAIVKHTSETYHNKYPQSHTDDVKKAAAHMSSLGGQARAKSLTSTQRSNIATKAAQARWK